MDRWGAWRRKHAVEDVGWYHTTPLADLIDAYGEKDDDATGYAEEPDPDNLVAEGVELFMTRLRAGNSITHLCLEARHRRVIGAIVARGASEYRMAQVCGVSLSGFRASCDVGYAMLRRFVADGWR